MGFHICKYCNNATSSGDVLLGFDNGHIYEMPDMIIHYVEVHNYMPSAQFITDVINGELVSSARRQSKGIPMRIGYLSGEFIKGAVPDTFIVHLKDFLIKAEKQGDRGQTRGITPT